MKILKIGLVSMLLCSLPALANWGGEEGGSVATGTFRASGTAQVEMQNELLSIRLLRSRAHVHVEYVLGNPGADVEVKAGFPSLGVVDPNGGSHREIEDYRLWVDGKQVAYQTEEGDVAPYKSLFSAELLQMPDLASQDGPCRLWWLSSQVHFASGQSHRVSVEYDSLYQYSYGGPSFDCYYNNDYFRYLLSTAAAWKGPIQQGQVNLEAVDVDGQSLAIKPAGRFQRKGAAWVWKFQQLSPTLADNIEVCMNNKLFTQINDRTSKESRSFYSFEGPEKARRYYLNYHGYTAKATSSAVGYPVSNVADFEAATAWVPGHGAGLGESVTLTLDRPEHLEQIGIVPGYGKSKDLYFANNRVRQLEVSVNGGRPVRSQLVDDFIGTGAFSPRDYQLVELGPYKGAARTIRISIVAVYPGSRHNDTCVSEILLRKRFPRMPAINHSR